MIQKTLVMAVAMAALLLTGCSQKKPEFPTQSSMNGVSDTMQIARETVSINDDAYTMANVNREQNIAHQANSGKYNSSSDGLQSIYFGFGAYGVSSDMMNNMNKNVNIMNNNGSRIKIEGNCDEFGTDEYNYALGLKRAKAVKDNLVAQGVSANKMVIISFGESNPVCSNLTDGCYAQNRRVDLRQVK